mgnify:CR=1 FL=1
MENTQKVFDIMDTLGVSIEDSLQRKAKIHKSKPMNRAKFKEGLGWFIPAMNSKRKACEINRIKASSKGRRIVKNMRIAERLQNIQSKAERKEEQRKFLNQASVKLQCEM